jgi:phage head maturation protease
MLIERRFSKSAAVQATRDISEGNGTQKIEGYAAVFNQEFVLYEDEAYRVIEIIAPGAFADVMNDDVRGLFNHDPNQVNRAYGKRPTPNATPNSLVLGIYLTYGWFRSRSS